MELNDVDVEGMMLKDDAEVYKMWIQTRHVMRVRFPHKAATPCTKP